MKTKTTRQQAIDKLNLLLETMDVPEKRKTDYGWLSRNLFVRNWNHPDIMAAIRIIKQLLNPHVEFIKL